MRQQRALPFVLLLAAMPAFSDDTAIRCGRLLDPASGKVTENAVILVRGERVAPLSVVGAAVCLAGAAMLRRPSAALARTPQVAAPQILSAGDRSITVPLREC